MKDTWMAMWDEILHTPTPEMLINNTWQTSLEESKKSSIRSSQTVSL